jgi:hypothetical protein
MFYPRSIYHYPHLVSVQVNTVEVPAYFCDVVLPFVVRMNFKDICNLVKGSISRLRATNLRRRVRKGVTVVFCDTIQDIVCPETQN